MTILSDTVQRVWDETVNSKPFKPLQGTDPKFAQRLAAQEPQENINSGPPSSLIGYVQRLNAIAAASRDTANRAHGISDMIVGSVPQNPSAGMSEMPQPSTILHGLQDAVQELELQIGRVNDALSRLSNGVGG